jgi:DNA-binding XRE family transcriptional regulator
MAQSPRKRKADDPALRAEVEKLRREGMSLNREDIAARHSVTTSVVQVVRSEIDRMLEAEASAAGRPGGRTVTTFDGRKLREHRIASRLMQEELAARAKVSRGEIGHLERGHRKPTLRTLRNLEKALGVPDGALLTTCDGERSA